MTDGGRQRRRLTATVTDLEVGRQRAFLIAVYDDDRAERERSLTELGLLTKTAGSDPIESELVRRPLLDPATFIGRGKAAELAATTEISRHRRGGLRQLVEPRTAAQSSGRSSSATSSTGSP